MPESCTTGTRGTPKANNTGKLYTLGKEDNEFNVHFPSYILQQLRETSSKPSFFSLSKNCKVYLFETREVFLPELTRMKKDLGTVLRLKEVSN